MAFNLGEAFYRIGVRDEEVKRGLRSTERQFKETTSRISRMRAAARMGADTDEFDRKVDDIERRLAIWRKRRNNANVGAATEEADRKITQLEAKLRLLTARRHRIEIDVDRQTEGKIQRLTDYLLRINKRGNDTRGIFERVGDALHNVRVEMGPFSLSLRGLVVTFATLAPIISSVAGVVGALAVSMSSAIVGAAGLAGALGTGLALALGGVFAVVKPLTNDLSNLWKAQDNYNKSVREYGKNSDEAAKKLSILHHVQRSVGLETSRQQHTVRDLGRRWRDLTASARPEFFALIDHALGRLNDRLPTFAREATRSFTAASTGARTLFDTLTNRSNTNALVDIIEGTNQAIPSLSRGFANLGTVIIRVVRSFSYWFKPFADGFRDWTQDLVTATSNGTKLNRVVDGLVHSAHTWGNVVYQTSRLVLGFFRAAVPEGDRMGDSIGQTVKAWADWMNSDEGQRKTRRFLVDARDLVDRIFNALGPIVSVWADVATAMRPMVSRLIDIVGFLAKAGATLIDLTGGAKGLVTGLAGLIIIKRAAGWTAELVRLLSAGTLISFLRTLRSGGGLKAAFSLFGDRGATPANPLFVADVRGGVGPGGGPIPGPGGRGGGVRGAVGKALKLVSVVGRGGAVVGTVLAPLFIADELTKGGLKPGNRNPATGEAVTPGKTPGLTPGQRRRAGAVDDVSPTREAPRATRQMVQAEAAAKRLQRALGDVNRHIWQLSTESQASIGQLAHKAATNFKEIRQTLGTNTAAGRDAVRRNFKAAADAITRAMNDGKGSTKTGMAAIERLARTHSNGTKVGVAQNMDAVRSVIAKTMRRGGQITDQGMKLIKQLMVKELKFYGLNERQAIASANVRTGEVAGGRRRQDFAKGGLRQFGRPGQTGTDTIQTIIGGAPAMVAPGEVAAVFTRQQQKIVNERLADFGGLPGLFAQVDTPHAARYQSGGWRGTSPVGLNPAARSIAQWAMNRYGAIATSTLRPGDSDSFHHIGAAVDLVSGNMNAMASGIGRAFGPRLAEGIHNPNLSIDSGHPVPSSFWGGATWAAHTSHVHEAAFGRPVRPGAVAIPRVIIKGADSPYRDIIQRVVDIDRGAAAKRLDATFGAMGGADISGFTGSWTKVQQQIAGQRGWSVSDWNWIISHESGGVPGVYNAGGSGAFGLGQLMSGTYARYGGGPGSSATEQIVAMANYIADRYGSPTAARAFWESHNWYQPGGIVAGSASTKFESEESESELRRRRRARFGDHLHHRPLIPRVKGDPSWLQPRALAPWRIVPSRLGQSVYFQRGKNWRDWQTNITLAESRATLTASDADDKKVRGFKREGLDRRQLAVRTRIHRIQAALSRMPSVTRLNTQIRRVEAQLARKGKRRIKGKERRKLEDQLKALKGRRKQRAGLQSELGGRRASLGDLWGDIGSIDAEIRDENIPADAGDAAAGPDQSADLQARLDQALARNAVLGETTRITEAAFATLTGAGDLGYHFTGAAPRGLLGSPLMSGGAGGVGQAVNSPSASSVLGALSAPLPSLGSGSLTVVNVHALYPSDPATYAAIGRVTTRALDGQGYVSDPRVATGV